MKMRLSLNNVLIFSLLVASLLVSPAEDKTKVVQPIMCAVSGHWRAHLGWSGSDLGCSTNRIDSYLASGGEDLPDRAVIE